MDLVESSTYLYPGDVDCSSRTYTAERPLEDVVES
jgi:hypothetical protein